MELGSLKNSGREAASILKQSLRVRTSTIDYPKNLFHETCVNPPGICAGRRGTGRGPGVPGVAISVPLSGADPQGCGPALPHQRSQYGPGGHWELVRGALWRPQPSAATGAQLLRYSGVQVAKFSGAQFLRCSSSQILRCSGNQILSFPGTQFLRCSGSQILRFSGAQCPSAQCSSAQVLSAQVSKCPLPG